MNKNVTAIDELLDLDEIEGFDDNDDHESGFDMIPEEHVKKINKFIKKEKFMTPSESGMTGKTPIREPNYHLNPYNNPLNKDFNKNVDTNQLITSYRHMDNKLPLINDLNNNNPIIYNPKGKNIFENKLQNIPSNNSRNNIHNPNLQRNYPQHFQPNNHPQHFQPNNHPQHFQPNNHPQHFQPNNHPQHFQPNNHPQHFQPNNHPRHILYTRNKENEKSKNDDKQIENYEETSTCSCVSVSDHVLNCKVCTKLYQNDRTIYIITIVFLSIICILLLKKVLNI